MAGATCAIATMAAAHAEAGTYHVLACSDLGSTSAVVPNNAWTQVPADAPTGLEAFVACPSMRGDRRDGIAAQDHTPGPFKVDAGAELFWRFAAPPGTSITGISVARSLGKAGAQPWRPYGRADGAVFDTCDVASGQDVCENTGSATFAINDASTIDYGVRCDTLSGQCTSGSSLHAVWMSLYAADVLVTDPSAPILTGGPQRPVVERRWLPPGNRERQLRGHRQHGDRRGGTGSSTAASRPLTAAAATTPGRVRAPTCRPTPSTA